jgi:hypothetical protein
VSATSARREELRASIARREAALRDAWRDLRVVHGPSHTIEERVALRPTPWLVGAFAIGLWLAAGD